MKNFYVDVTLFALFVAEMCFHFLPKILHEILGVAMFALIIFHVAINRRRFMSLKKKFLSVALNVALTICAAIIFVSGVCMSNFLFVDVISPELQRNMTIHQLHVAAPYVLMILLGVHVGLHWRELFQRFFKRREKFLLATAVILSAVGAYGLYLNRVADRIMMKHIFATPATELPAIIFALMIVGGVALFALITVALNRK